MFEVTTAKKYKDEMEKLILIAVIDFENKTGMKVTDIRFQDALSIKENKRNKFKCEARVEL